MAAPRMGMDYADLAKLLTAIGFGVGVSAAVLTGMVLGWRKLFRGERREHRDDRQGDTLSAGYERLIGSHRAELDRMEAKLLLLEERTTKQNAALRDVVFELGVARQDRAELSGKLREVKEAQTKAVDEGEITSPFVEIETRLATGYTSDPVELERRMREGPIKR